MFSQAQQWRPLQGSFSLGAGAGCLECSYHSVWLAQTCLSGLQCHINLRRCYYSFEGSFVLVQRPTGGISKSARPPWELFSKIISECLETVVSAKLLVWERPMSVGRVIRHSSQSSIATGSFFALILKADECPVTLTLFPVCLAVLRQVFFVFFF